MRNRLLIAMLTLAALPAWAEPEGRGPFTPMEVDLGRPVLAGVAIPVRAYVPAERSSLAPEVAVIHGYLRQGRFMAELGRTLASHGFVALVPDMPCGLGGCDHDANAAQIVALLELGAQGTGPLAGRVDGSARAVIGHSFGGLSAFLAAARAPDLKAAVLLDPNDDQGIAAQAAARVGVPTLLLSAEVPGSCNGSRWRESVYPGTAGPRMALRVRGSAHCDAEEPSDQLCPLACGRGDATKSAVFRRYAVAFVGCALAGVFGEVLGEDGMGAIDRVDRVGFGPSGCAWRVTGDAGVAIDAGLNGGVANDATTVEDAASGVSEDAAPTADVRPSLPGKPASSCACTRPTGSGAAWWLGGLLLLGRASRRAWRTGALTRGQRPS